MTKPTPSSSAWPRGLTCASCLLLQDLAQLAQLCNWIEILPWVLDCTKVTADSHSLVAAADIVQHIPGGVLLLPLQDDLTKDTRFQEAPQKLPFPTSLLHLPSTAPHGQASHASFPEQPAPVRPRQKT